MALPYATTPSQLQQVKQDLEKAEARLEEKIEAVEEVAEDSIPAAEKGVPDGVATLDGAGKVPASQLPSYVDDIEEYATLSEFPAEGETGKIYVAIDTGFTYRWSGTAYVQMSSGLELGETSTTAYAGDKGKANADAIAAIQQTLEGGVVHPETGKGLSSNDFTDADQSKLSGIANQATKTVANPALRGNDSILDGVEVNGTKFGLLKDNHLIYDSKDHSGELGFSHRIDPNDISMWFVTKQSIDNIIDEYEGTVFVGTPIDLNTYDFINKLKVVVTITPVIDGVRDETKTFVRQLKFEDIDEAALTSEYTFDYGAPIQGIPETGGIDLMGTIGIIVDSETGDAHTQVDSISAFSAALQENLDVDRVIWLHPNSVDGELLFSGVNYYPAEEGDYNISVDESGNASYKPATSGGTTVVANPTLVGTESNLTGLQVGDTKYVIPSGGGGGTTVVANPTLVGTEDNLTGLQVGNTSYKVPYTGRVSFAKFAEYDLQSEIPELKKKVTITFPVGTIYTLLRRAANDLEYTYGTGSDLSDVSSYPANGPSFYSINFTSPINFEFEGQSGLITTDSFLKVVMGTSITSTSGTPTIDISISFLDTPIVALQVEDSSAEPSSESTVDFKSDVYYALENIGNIVIELTTIPEQADIIYSTINISVEDGVKLEFDRGSGLPVSGVISVEEVFANMDSEWFPMILPRTIQAFHADGE